MKRNRKEFPMGTRENKCQSYKKLWKIGEMCVIRFILPVLLSVTQELQNSFSTFELALL